MSKSLTAKRKKKSAGRLASPLPLSVAVNGHTKPATINPGRTQRMLGAADAHIQHNHEAAVVMVNAFKDTSRHTARILLTRPVIDGEE